MEQAVFWYAICAVVLFVKMFSVSVYQGYYRISRMTFNIPEDAALVDRTAAADELSQVQRAARVWLNDLENIPIFLALGVAYIWVGASPAAAAWLFIGFTAARVLHTVFFLNAMQPWRTIAYAVGIACLFGMCILILTALLG